MKRFSLLMAMGYAVTVFAVPEIETGSVSLTQDAHQNLAISYRLKDGEPAIVTLQAFLDGEALPWSSVRTLSGDVCKLVEPGEHTAYWQLRPDVPNRVIPAGKLSVQLTAWSTNEPPPYMMVDLVQENTRFYYPDLDALPYGHPTNNAAYRRDYMVMRRIPAAGMRFRMGVPPVQGAPVADGRYDQRYVSFSDDFYMGIFEVTVGQVKMVSGGYSPHDAGPGDKVTRRDEYPIGYIPYTTVRGYCESGADWPHDGHKVSSVSLVHKFRVRTGIQGMDLPTAAQWEFACRAGTSGRVYREDVPLGDLAWFGDNSASGEDAVLGNVRQRHIPGQKLPNAWNLYDMLGNMEEWTLDVFKGGVMWGSYVKNFDSAVEEHDPVGYPNSSYAEGGRGREPFTLWGGADRVTKGGHFERGSELTISAFVTSWEDYSTGPQLGFRLICPISPTCPGVPLLAADLPQPQPE